MLDESLRRPHKVLSQLNQLTLGMMRACVFVCGVAWGQFELDGRLKAGIDQQHNKPKAKWREFSKDRNPEKKKFIL